MIGGVANMNKENKAVVAIDYRLIDAETSEIIATGEAKGESKRKSSGIGECWAFSARAWPAWKST